MNYKEIYLWGKGELEKAGVPEFDLDARLLLEHICHTNRNTLLVHGDRVVSEIEENQYVEAIRKRSSRIPLQHITGVNQRQLWHYAAGRSKPRRNQAEKIITSLNKLGKELTTLTV